jgi:hypothetical protein
MIIKNTSGTSYNYKNYVLHEYRQGFRALKKRYQCYLKYFNIGCLTGGWVRIRRHLAINPIEY